MIYHMLPTKCNIFLNADDACLVREYISVTGMLIIS